MDHGTGFCLEKMDTSQAKTVERPRQREQKQLTKKKLFPDLSPEVETLVLHC
jgi:hypothetical protein